jgi:hypothetical protein
MFSLRSWNASGLQMHPQEAVEKIILDIPFSYRDTAARAGVRWDSEIKACFFEKRAGQALPLELEGFEPKQFSWEEKIQRELNGEVFPTVPAEKSITLRPHQLAELFPGNNAIESRKIVYICK